jgi:antitoxin YefM
MDRVHAAHEPVFITRRKAEPVVMLSLSEYNGITETLRLLRSPKNRERVSAAIDELDAGEGVMLPES